MGWFGSNSADTVSLIGLLGALSDPPISDAHVSTAQLAAIDFPVRKRTSSNVFDITTIALRRVRVRRRSYLGGRSSGST